MSHGLWKRQGYYCYYIYKHLPNPMSITQLTTYHKVTSPNAHSSEVGQYRVTFADGSEITHETISAHDPNFHWPSIPLVANSEDDAKIFSRSWAAYIKTQSKVNLIDSDNWESKER